ncbi:MAG: Na+/H+ antiporter NhaA, partial [Planctomycetota bacterium]
MSGSSAKGGKLRVVFEYSMPLIFGALIALAWANLDLASYEAFVNYDLGKWVGLADTPENLDDMALRRDLEAQQSRGGGDVVDVDQTPATDGDQMKPADDAGDEHEDGEDHDHDADHGDRHDSDHGDGHDADHGDGHAGEHHHHGFSVHFIINDILMALFFAIAMKEVWESMLPGGSLANPRRAATPLMATFGGIVGPVLVYFAGCLLFDSFSPGVFDLYKNGWAVPCATDIAFSYLVARFIFGAGHPAIAFLLLLAIADDAAGLLILAVFYPKDPIEFQWLLLAVAAMGVAWGLRKGRVISHWAYLLGPGVMCWFAFYLSNVHPALGLVPIVPFLPGPKHDLGIFAREEYNQDDPLNAFEHFWKNPVEVILGVFGLANAGVVLSSLGDGTWIVLAGLLLGKPLGITLMTLIAVKVFRLQKPDGMG